MDIQETNELKPKVRWSLLLTAFAFLLAATNFGVFVWKAKKVVPVQAAMPLQAEPEPTKKEPFEEAIDPNPKWGNRFPQKRVPGQEVK
jgi:hypothetical protein